MFFDCGMAQSAPEWFHRKRGILKACRMMNAVTRLPGLCGLPLQSAL
jgi:hypothetical protein